jgi:hypothetical protein
MTLRISTAEFEYAGRKVVIGDEVEVEPEHEPLFVAMGWIARVETDPIPGYMTRAMIDNPQPINPPAMTARPRRANFRKVG